MKIQEKVREIMLAGELSSAEKLDRLHALIPAEVQCKSLEAPNKFALRAKKKPCRGSGESR